MCRLIDIFLFLTFFKNQMKKRLSILYFLIFFGVTNSFYSQENSSLNANEFLTMHYYTFEGNMNQEKIDDFEKVLLKIDFVSQAKVKYKPEKNMGQIVLVVKEKNITKEGDKTFSPTSIKQAILKNGLSPMEYSTGKYNQ